MNYIVKHRNTARPFFAKDRIRDFEIFEKYTARALSILSSRASSGQPIEAQDLYARLTLDATSEFLFGKDLETLSFPLPIPGKTAMGRKGSAMEGSWGSFVDAFESCQQIITTRARLGYVWPLLELFKDKTTDHVETIHKWLDPLVKRALDEKTVREKSGTTASIMEKTFLQHLADSTDGESSFQISTGCMSPNNSQILSSFAINY